jgi:hypothetical protein
MKAEVNKRRKRNMKMKAIALGIVAVMIIAGGLAAVDAGNGNGNGGPKPGTDFNGPHYNLNLIGKKKDMPGDYDNPDRHVMFVPLDSTDMWFPINNDEENGNVVYNPDGTISYDVEYMQGIKITITQGSEFAMIDGDATDGYGAFQLGPGKYWVYIAVKAKSPKYPDAYTDITGWVEAYDNNGNLWYYISVGYVQVKKGKNSWTDATGLFFVTEQEDPFGWIESIYNTYEPVGNYGIWVFDYMSGLDAWWEDSGYTIDYDFSDLAYFWQLVNSGNKLIQVRFYPMN